MTKVVSLLSLVLAAPLVLATPAAAADLSGTWAVSADIGGNAVAATCTFTQADKTVSGSCKGDLGDSKTTGTIDGQKVGFKYDIDFMGMMFTLVYDGTLDEAGNGIKGTVNIAGAGDGAFTATKK